MAFHSLAENQAFKEKDKSHFTPHFWTMYPHLLDGDCWSPVFVFIKKGQTHGTRRIDIGVEYRWFKFALKINSDPLLALFS